VGRGLVPRLLAEARMVADNAVDDDLLELRGELFGDPIASLNTELHHRMRERNVIRFRKLLMDHPGQHVSEARDMQFARTLAIVVAVRSDGRCDGAQTLEHD